MQERADGQAGGWPTREVETESERRQGDHSISVSDWQTFSFFGHDGQLRCWIISRIMR